MNYLDIIILIPLIWGAYKGYSKGFIIEIATLIALGLGIYGGLKFSFIVTAYIEDLLPITYQKMMPLISFGITFILIVLIIFSLAKILQGIIKMVALGFINRLAGAIFGALKFGLIVSVVLYMINLADAKINFIDTNKKSSSLLYKPISRIAPLIIPKIKRLKAFSS